MEEYLEDEIEELRSIHYKELQERYYNLSFNIARKGDEYKRFLEILK